MAEAEREPLRVLFVCTANICRSPVAEHLARRHGGDIAITFESAGFLRHGVPCPDKLMSVVATRGVDLSHHRSRMIDPQQIREADVVATMEARHVREVTSIDPTAWPKSVPLLELDRLLGIPMALPGLLDRLAARDPRSYLGSGSPDDVPDPYGRSRRQYRRAVDLIDLLVGRLVGNLRA